MEPRFREPGDKPKRFYKAVDIAPAEGGHAVRLDGREVRTPKGGRLVLPTLAAAELAAEDWRRQGETLDLAGMHATRLANTAIDAVPAAREATAASIADYAGADLLCYFAEAPQALVERQARAWEPLLERAQGELGLSFLRARGVVHQAQPEETPKRVKALALALDDFRLAGLAFGASLYGSAVLALAVQRGWLEGETALDVSRVDEAWQEEQWGVDDDAAERAGRLRTEARMLGDWFRALDLP